MLPLSRVAGSAVDPSGELPVGVAGAFEILVEAPYFGLLFVVQQGEFVDLRFELLVGNDRDPIGGGY